jgi:hypothetical protein
MARYAKKITTGEDNALHLSLGVIAMCFPMEEMQKVIDRCGRANKRMRDLPAAVVAYYVIGLSLYPNAGYEAVLGWLLCGMSWLSGTAAKISSKGALSRARTKLGAEPMQQAFEQMAQPLKKQDLPGSYWKGLHLVALDGSTLALQDTDANAEAFKRPSNQNGRGAYPLARFVSLVEVGTHILFASKIGAYTDSEQALAKQVLPSLNKGMLCMADRLFFTPELWQQAQASGAHLLWRVKCGLKLEATTVLPDGSWLAKWSNPYFKTPQTVRVIEYKLKDDPEEIYRLVTTILDPRQASALELARLYPERWEIELSIREGKRILRSGQVTLRSKTPELVKQEFWGLLMAHYVVRKMMAQAAYSQRIDPDLLSFKGAVEILRQNQTASVRSFSP